MQDVSGSSVTVELLDETVTGLCFVAGEAYRVGQVGGFVRIPIGLVNLYGVISQVGAGAAPRQEGDSAPYGNRWLTVQLVGEGTRAGAFQRGVSQHPTIEDPVHIVTEADLRAIYGPGEPNDFVAVGHLASAESIPTLVNLNKLVTRHSAVVGTTGAGKSTTVAGLLSALSDPVRYPSARVLIMDIHGEYAAALGERSNVFRVSGDALASTKALLLPYWALSLDELVSVTFGQVGEGARAAIADLVLELKKEALGSYGRAGVTAASVTVDSPVPFSIHRLWLELHRQEHLTVVPSPGAGADDREPAYVLDEKGQPQQLGDAISVTPPLYRTIKTTGPPNLRVQHGGSNLGIRQQLATLASRLRDPQFAFLFGPSDWRPDVDGKVSRDLDDWLKEWIGGDRPITILDLSGVPSAATMSIVGIVLRILYDALFWARNLSEGGRERPLLVVLEEAHSYLGAARADYASASVRRIAKEGRKYGVGVMLVSQRPSEIDSTILSQCGTLFAMRLANETDRGQIASSAPESLKGLFEMLPSLRTGEAIIVGEAVSLPARTLISPPPASKRPDSADPRVAMRGSLYIDGFDGPGGWNQRLGPQDYASVVEQWRKQSPRFELSKKAETDAIANQAEEDS